MPILVNCPCGSPLRAREEYAGKQARCPKCGRVLDVPALPAAQAAEPPIITPIADPPARPAPKGPARPAPAKALPPAPPVKTYAVHCPQCDARLKLDSSPLGKSVTCPKCREPFVVPLTWIECPECATILQPGVLVCNHCRYDFRTRARRPAKWVERIDDPFTPKALKEKPKRLEPVSWREILLTPFDAESVIPESIILTVWCLIWFVGNLVLTFVFSLGPLGWALFLPVLAGFVWLWLYSIGYNLTKAVLMGGALLAISLVLSFALRGVAWAAGQGESNALLAASQIVTAAGSFFLVPFFIAGILGMFLRTLSFVFGKYFAICNSAAHGAIMSSEDSGGLVDLGYAVVIHLIALLPAGLIGLLTAVAFAFDAWPIGVLGIGLLFVALLFAYCYLPMAIGVVALERSLDPMVVLHWSLRCLPDYLLLLAAMLPFYFVVGVVSLVLDWSFVRLASDTVQPFKAMIEVFGSVGILTVLGQYNAVVQVTALGRILRRNEAKLGWYRPE